MGPRHISETIIGRKLKFYKAEILHTYTQVQVLFQGMKISTLRGVRGVQRPLVQIGDPPRISENIRARRLKFYTHLDRIKCSFRAWQFSARVRRGGGSGGRPGGLKLQCPAIATFSSFIFFTFCINVTSLTSPHCGKLQYPNICRRRRNYHSIAEVLSARGAH